MKSKRLNPFQVLRDQLAIMSFYERFEQVVALVLSAVIAVIRVIRALCSCNTAGSTACRPGCWS